MANCKIRLQCYYVGGRVVRSAGEASLHKILSNRKEKSYITYTVLVRAFVLNESFVSKSVTQGQHKKVKHMIL